MSWPRRCLFAGVALIVLAGCGKPPPTVPSAPPEPESAPVVGPEEPPRPPAPLKPATPPPTEEEMRRLWESPEESDLPSEEDVAALRQEVRDDGGNPEAHYRLGQALQLRGQRAEAWAEFREVLRLDPHHAGAQAALRSLSAGAQ